MRHVLSTKRNKNNKNSNLKDKPYALRIGNWEKFKIIGGGYANRMKTNTVKNHTNHCIITNIFRGVWGSSKYFFLFLKKNSKERKKLFCIQYRPSHHNNCLKQRNWSFGNLIGKHVMFFFLFFLFLTEFNPFLALLLLLHLFSVLFNCMR